MKLGAFTGQQQKKFCGIVTEMRANEIVALHPITILLFQQYMSICFYVSDTYSACVFNKTSTPTPRSLTTFSPFKCSVDGSGSAWKT